jgi:hypothetical protein
MSGYWYVGLSYLAGSTPIEGILLYQFIGLLSIFKEFLVISFPFISKPALVFTLFQLDIT